MATPTTRRRSITSDTLRFNVDNVFTLVNRDGTVTTSDLVDEAVCVLRTGIDTDSVSCELDGDTNILLHVSARLFDHIVTTEEFVLLLNRRTDTMHAVRDHGADVLDYIAFRLSPI